VYDKNFSYGDGAQACVSRAHCAAETSFLSHAAVELSRVLIRYSAAFDSVKSRVLKDLPLAVADIRDDLRHAHWCAEDAFIDIRQRDLRHV
jgi:hypothetical protein